MAVVGLMNDDNLEEVGKVLLEMMWDDLYKSFPTAWFNLRARFNIGEVVADTVTEEQAIVLLQFTSKGVAYGPFHEVPEDQNLSPSLHGLSSDATHFSDSN